MISEPSGSDSKENKESEVKTFAVSSVVSPFFFAMIEKTAKVRMGDTTGEIYALTNQLRDLRKWRSVHLPKPIVQIRSFRNFFEISSSRTRSCCKSSLRTSVRPVIFTPFIDPSIAVVAVMRRSIASSHMAWRCTTRLVAPNEPARDTTRLSNLGK